MRRHIYKVKQKFGVRNGNVIVRMPRKCPKGDTVRRYSVGMKLVDYSGCGVNQSDIIVEALEKGYVEKKGYKNGWNPMPPQRKKTWL